MKKFIFSAFIVLALLVVASPAFALQCKEGNYGSDECWTTGQTATNDVAVIAGTVMVYDFKTPVNEGNDADNAAFYVRAASSQDQGVYVAGVAQKNYSSGDRVELLVRGQGQLRYSTAAASGDRLWISASSTTDPETRGRAGNATIMSANSLATKDKAIAFALETVSANTTADAYIVIV